MAVYLNDLKLTEEQKQEFEKIRKWAFMCEMGSGFSWENKSLAIEKINNIIKFERKIYSYNPDFYNGNDIIILCD
jgi:hypothetical protein